MPNSISVYILSWGSAFIPGLIYLLLAITYFNGFYMRRDRLLRLLRATDAKRYYQRVYDIADSDSDTSWNILADIRKAPYAVPLSICIVLATGFTVLSLMKVGLPLGFADKWYGFAQKLPPYSIAGFWGAYVWGLYDCLMRMRVRNWTPSSLQFVWHRLIIGIALGSLAGIPFKESYSALVAFGLGTFPVDTLKKWLQGTVAQRLKITEAAQIEIKPSWSTIQGLSQDTIDRLVEADVGTPGQLATVDPVSLMTKTNLEWRMVLDLIDQAILAGYVAEKIDGLRSLGVRGVIELAAIYERMSSPPETPQAEATVKAIASVLNQDPAAVHNLIRNVYEDPQVNLIWELWFKQI